MDEMKTDVDSALKDIADFFIKNRRSMTNPELDAILKKHVESKAEAEKFVRFLETEPGQLRFKTHLRERKEAPSTLKEPSTYEWEGWLEDVPFSFVGLSGRTIIDKKTGATYRSVVSGVDLGAPYVLIHGKKLWEVAVPEFELKRYWVMPKPSYLKEPFIKVGDRVRHTGTSFRLGDFPEGVWLKAGAEGKVVEYRPEVVLTEEERSPEDAVVAWNIGVKSAIGPENEGKDWERVKASYLKEATTVVETETECQIISPQYYDILTWLNIPVPDYSFAIEPEVKERKIDEVLQKLKDGVSRITDSAIFREFLVTMSKFWEYSFGNQILIMLQRRDATRVAGFVTWKDLGRHVKAGERGIAILAPCLPPSILMCPLCEKTFSERELRTHLVEVHRREDVSILVREAREEAVAVPTPTYFKVVYVFDVSQTEGKPLPEITVPVLSGAFSKELYDKLMKLAMKQGLTVSFEAKPGLSPTIKGTLLGKSIWVKGDEPEAQRLKTLGHELAHYFTEAVYFIPRAEAEVIAESVAFVICAHFGFDSGTRSFPYVALWAKEKKVLEQNLGSIRKISGRIIEELGG